MFTILVLKSIDHKQFYLNLKLAEIEIRSKIFYKFVKKLF